VNFNWDLSSGVMVRFWRPSTWILLDELNIAPQSVPEGLNAILDHRDEVYIPELNKTFEGQQM
jgi:midasin